MSVTHLDMRKPMLFLHGFWVCEYCRGPVSPIVDQDVIFFKCEGRGPIRPCGFQGMTVPVVDNVVGAVVALSRQGRVMRHVPDGDSPEERLARIRELLHPTDETYCAEPIDTDDARWLLAEVERLTGQRAAALHALEDALHTLDEVRLERP